MPEGAFPPARISLHNRPCALPLLRPENAKVQQTGEPCGAGRYSWALLVVTWEPTSPRVKKAGSDTIAEALRQRCIDVEYLVKENEGDGLHNEENSFDLYGVMGRFSRASGESRRRATGCGKK